MSLEQSKTLSLSDYVLSQALSSGCHGYSEQDPALLALQTQGLHYRAVKMQERHKVTLQKNNVQING